MSSTLYSIYLSKTFELAKTLVIKSNAVVDTVNASLAEVGEVVDITNPESWKYYKNIAGEYHFTDTMMTVTSMDTLETIEFTKENLQIHRATANEYAFGTRYYKELVRRYPDQEILILGILNPVDKTTAIMAEDGDILYYNRALVEDNEYDLIPRLQSWIKGYLIRWNVPAYSLSDDLYSAAMLGILYLQLPSQILNIRLDNCHTRRAHSYHIREYLASHGKLDVYMDFLTKKQALWLYRNIRYIHRNVGKKETFSLLVDNILTERGFPLASYEMRHNLENQPQDLLPEIELLQKPINLMHLGGRNDLFTPREVLVKEFPLAKDNDKVVDETEADLNVRMKHNAISTVPTKVLESSVVDMSDDGPFRLSDVLMQNWIYLSSHDRYNTIVSFTNPANGERLHLNAKDAFVLYLYAFNKAHGITLEEIPLIEVHRVRKIPTPTFEELRAISEEQYIPDEFIWDVLSNLPPVGMYINSQSFYETCELIHRRMQEHRYQYTSIEHLIGRGQAEAVAMHLYATVPCKVAEVDNYPQWFNERGFDFSNLTDYDFDLISLELLAGATGNDLNTSKSLKELQEAMMRLMTQLSSYTVQYIATINSEPYIVVDWSAIRLGDWFNKTKASFFAPGMSTHVQRIDNKSHISVMHEVGLASKDYRYDARYKDTITYDTGLGIKCTSRPSYNIHMDMIDTRVMDILMSPLALNVILGNNELTTAFDLSLSSIDALLKNINDSNQTALVLSELRIGVPHVRTGNFNTQVLIGSNGSIHLTGSQTFHYNRLTLSTIIGDATQIPRGSLLTSVDLMMYLNETYQLNLREADIVIEIIEGDTYTLKMKPTSYLWVGETEFTLMDDV